jgi:diguanylate cyclase (GGDEF)-like protein
VDGERQWFKSRQGADLEETPREHAFCSHAILGDKVMVVDDATKDLRFADNPLVTGETGIRFYAGAPLRTSDGYTIGTLCVIDQLPRKMDERERGILADLAALVVHEMELRRWNGTDGFTGLYTAEFIKELCQREINRASRINMAFTVMAIEMEIAFRDSNGPGRDALDIHLRAFGRRLRNDLRSYDQLGRWGDRGFAAILPGTSLQQAVAVLARVRDMADEYSGLPGQESIKVHFGAASLTSADRSLDDIMSRARLNFDTSVRG